MTVFLTFGERELMVEGDFHPGEAPTLWGDNTCDGEVAWFEIDNVCVKVDGKLHDVSDIYLDEDLYVKVDYSYQGRRREGWKPLHEELAIRACEDAASERRLP